MLLHEDGKPRGFWNLIRVERPIRGADGTVRGAVIRVPSKGGKTTTLRRPVTHLYPLEIKCTQRVTSNVDGISDQVQAPVLSTQEDSQPSTRPPKRAAAQKARQWLQSIADEL